MPFEVRLLPETIEQLQALDPSIARRIWEKLEWIGEHADQIRHLPLSSDLAGLYKRRVGDYRIIYEVILERRILLVHRVGHRRDVYEG